MKPFFYSLFIISMLSVYSCKTAKPDVKHPAKNGLLVLSMERTPCFGRCPVYSIRIYENGLFVYDTKKFTDTSACRYSLLSKEELAGLKQKFSDMNFFQFEDKYPADKRTPTDLPSCILFFNNGKQQKTIIDKRWDTPETLTQLELAVDNLVNSKKLQFCDN